MPAGEAAVMARIRQLQELIEQAQTGVSPSQRTPETQGGFSTALAQASATTPVAFASSAPTGGGASTPYDGLIAQAAQKYGLDPAVLHGLIQQESGFDPNAQSSAGAAGLTQLMPGTASSMGVSNPLNPAEAIEGGARYLSGLMSQFSGNATDALAAYNAGPGAVSQYGGVPPYAETQDYVTKVLGYAQAWRQSHPESVPAGGLA
jgi:soluble lytic murein transglycosylase-like protein